MATHEGYCVKCKAKKTVNTDGHKQLKNGVWAAHGKCPTCGVAVHRMIGKNKPS